MILFKSPEELLEARHAVESVESVESDTVALKTLMFEIFWDAEVLGTFRALPKPSPPKHQVTLEQHRFASTLKRRYDDMTMWSAWIVRPGPCRVCPDPKISNTQPFPYSWLFVEFRCSLICFWYFLVVSGERKIGSWNIHWWVLPSDSEWVDILTRLKKSPTGQGQTIHLGTHWWRVASSVRVEL